MHWSAYPRRHRICEIIDRSESSGNELPEVSNQSDIKTGANPNAIHELS